MSLVSKLLALVVVFGIAGLVSAKDASAAKPVHGHFVKLDGKNIVIKSGHKGEEKEVSVPTDDKTTVTIDGKSATLSDLKEGQNVTITETNGVASHVEVAAHKAKEKPASK